MPSPQPNIPYEKARRVGANRSSHETQRVEGHWRQAGVLYRDNLVRLVVDVPDTAKNRRWMKAFKQRWKAKLEQLELWMVSYPVTVE
jgi:hypothetical protein